MKFEAPGAGGKAGSTKSLHATGTGLNGYGGYVAVPLAACYDASAYKGISFWLKGNVGTAPYVKVSIATPKTIPMAEGGDDSCNTASQCYNHFTIQYFRVSDVWTRYAFTWAQLAQGWDNTGGAVPRDYQPEKEITGLNFAPVWPDEDPANPIQGKSFDFSLDDVSFDTAGPFVDTGFKSLVSEATFNGAFPGYNAGAFGNPYQTLATTLDDARFSRIAREGSLDDRKREIAAMMAHMKQETGGLTLLEEIDGASKNYCQAADTYYPCVGGQGYYGRGPLQLSWNYNYGQVGEFFASDFGWNKSMLLSSPGTAISSPDKAWKTSMFFWMAWKNEDKTSCFSASTTASCAKASAPRSAPSTARSNAPARPPQKTAAPPTKISAPRSASATATRTSPAPRNSNRRRADRERDGGLVAVIAASASRASAARGAIRAARRFRNKS